MFVKTTPMLISMSIYLLHQILLYYSCGMTSWFLLVSVQLLCKPAAPGQSGSKLEDASFPGHGSSLHPSSSPSPPPPPPAGDAAGGQGGHPVLQASQGCPL